MKNLLWMLTMVWACVCCQKHNTKSKMPIDDFDCKDSIEYYTEQVRQGNAEAYLKLVEFYHLGEKDLERRVIKMALMGGMAEIYGVIPSFRLVFESLEDDDSVKMVYKITQLVGDHHYDEARSIGKKLENAGIPLEVVNGFIAMEKNQMDDALDIFSTLERKECRIAKIFAAILRDDTEDMLMAASEYPLLYNEMAKRCMAREDSSGIKFIEAEVYFRKADERGCIDDEGVRFLLEYNDYLTQTGAGHVDSVEVERLKKLKRAFKTHKLLSPLWAQ